MIEMFTAPTWLETYRGRRVDFEAPDPATICIADIAHSLAMQCRYTGQCQRFYSVAEHSVFCSRWLEAHGHDRRLQLLGLLHDAAEAYLGDLHPYLKRLFPEWNTYAARLDAAIYEALRLSPPTNDEQQIVDLADEVALATEIREQMLSGGCGWDIPADPAEEPHIEYWGPPQAAWAFVERYIWPSRTDARNA